MDPVSLIPAAAALVVALVSCYALIRLFGFENEPGHLSSIDGLRGYLAFLVFIHHSARWFFYLRTGDWDVLPSRVYVAFGQASVLVFFMITGFLFYSKILAGRKRDIDWMHLYLSRVLRLTPAYFVAMALLVGIVAVVSHGRLHESPAAVASEIGRWLAFTLPGFPDINGITYTWVIIAGVTWSLRYEWLFYLSLPALAIATRVRTPLALQALGVVALVAVFFMLAFRHSHLIFVLAFVGGIAAAIAVQYRWLTDRLKGTGAALAVAALLVLQAGVLPSSNSVPSILVLSAVFLVIASGNTLFGLLELRVSRMLGEMTYSIYLLHAIVIYTVFRFAVGFDRIRHLSAAEYWGVVLLITPVVIGLSFASFRCVELPCMRLTEAATDWARSFMAKSTPHARF